MRNRTYGGVRGRKTKVGRKLLRFPPTRFPHCSYNMTYELKKRRKTSLFVEKHYLFNKKQV